MQLVGKFTGAFTYRFSHTESEDTELESNIEKGLEDLNRELKDRGTRGRRDVKLSETEVLYLPYYYHNEDKSEYRKPYRDANGLGPHRSGNGLGRYGEELQIEECNAIRETI